jgi:phosphatidylglycerophosphatase A
MNAPAPLRQKPGPAFVFRHPAHFIAFGFGSGLAPVAPGTFGSLVGIPIAWLLLPALSDVGYACVVIAAFALGVWACDVTGRALGIADYGGIVWDEVVAMLLVLWVVPLTPAWIAAAFLLFRVFDIVKLPPARYFDRNWKHGLGVMMDDIAAAGQTVIVLLAAQWIAQRVGA